MGIPVGYSVKQCSWFVAGWANAPHVQVGQQEAAGYAERQGVVIGAREEEQYQPVPGLSLHARPDPGGRAGGVQGASGGGEEGGTAGGRPRCGSHVAAPLSLMPLRL